MSVSRNRLGKVQSEVGAWASKGVGASVPGTPAFSPCRPVVIGQKATMSKVSCVLFANIVRFSFEVILVYFLPVKMLYFSIHLLGVSPAYARSPDLTPGITFAFRPLP